MVETPKEDRVAIGASTDLEDFLLIKQVGKLKG